MNKRVAERLKAGLKKFRPILESAKARDVSESDTALIIHDMLAEVFGWDKYAEVTSEFEIRGTYCDLAIKHEGKLKYLIEVKAINNDLKENHVRQATNYAATEGTEWVVLTNGGLWQVYQVKFEQPIQAEYVFDFDLLAHSASKEELMSKVFTLCKEAVKKEAIEEFAAKRQMVNKHTIAAVITSPALLTVVRREIRRMNKDLSVSVEEIQKIVETEVIKRELIEGDETKEAMRRLKRAAGRRMKAASSKKDNVDEEPAPTDDHSAI